MYIRVFYLHTLGEIPVKLSVRGWPFATAADELEAELRYSAAECPNSMRLNGSLQWPRAELVTSEWSLESLGAERCQRINWRAFRTALKIKSAGAAVLDAEYRQVAANLTALLTARTTQTELTVLFNGLPAILEVGCATV